MKAGRVGVAGEKACRKGGGAKGERRGRAWRGERRGARRRKGGGRVTHQSIIISRHQSHRITVKPNIYASLISPLVINNAAGIAPIITTMRHRNAAHASIVMPVRASHGLPRSVEEKCWKT